jgi:hypothetical protein
VRFIFTKPLGLTQPISFPRSLSDIDLSTAANDPQPSASCSARKNTQRIPTNTPPDFPGLWPRIWPHLIVLLTKARLDRLITITRYRCCGIKTGDACSLLSDLAFCLLRTDSPIATVRDIQAHHRPMSPNGWSVTIKVPRGLGARMFEVSSASRPGVGWQSGVITIPQC